MYMHDEVYIQRMKFYYQLFNKTWIPFPRKCSLCCLSVTSDLARPVTDIKAFYKTPKLTFLGALSFIKVIVRPENNVKAILSAVSHFV